jgi:hypothetical protein
MPFLPRTGLAGIVLLPFAAFAYQPAAVRLLPSLNCDTLAVLAAQAPASWFTTLPEVTHLIIPPSRWPKDFRTANVLVTIPVDTAGRPVADSIAVTGTADSGYVRRVRRSFRNFRFRPATKGDCRVPGRYRQTIQFQK